MYLYDDLMKERAQAKEEATLSDYARMMNSVATRVMNPELYGSKPDESFKLSDHKEYLNSLDDSEFEAALGADSEANMRNRVERTKLFNEAAERISRDNIVEQVGYSLLTGAADPINFIPIGGAITKAKKAVETFDTLKRVGTVAAVSGTVGAGSAMAAEAVMEAQGMPHDYGNAALFGFILGGGIGGVAEALSRTNYKEQLANAFTKNDSLDDVNNINPVFKFDEENPNVPPQFSTIAGGKWTNSDSTIAWASDNVNTRIIASKLAPPFAGKKGSYVFEKTARDDIEEQNGMFNSHIRSIDNVYKEQVKSGNYSGNRDQFYIETGAELQRVAAQQQRAVIADPEVAKLNREAEALEAKTRREIDKLKQQEATAAKELAKDKKLSAEDKKILKELKNTQIKELEDKLTKALDDIDNMKYKKMDELYAKELAKVKLSPQAQALSDYFKNMLVRGKAEGVPELARISENRLYMPKQFDTEAVNKMSSTDLKSLVMKAMRTHPANADLFNSEKGIAKANAWADEYVAGIKSSSFDKNFNDRSFFTQMDGRVSFLNKKAPLDDEIMQPVLRTHAQDVGGSYHYWMRGQFAIRNKFPELKGVTMDETYNTLAKTYLEPLKQGTPGKKEIEELNSIDRMLQHTLGTLQIPKDGTSGLWKFSRIMTQVNAMTMSGMMGLNQILEIPNALWATGFNRIFHKQFYQLFKDVHKDLFTNNVNKNEFLEELIQMGHLSALFEQNGVARVVDTDSTFNVSKLEHGLAGLNSKIFKYNGMRGMTATLEAIVGSNVIMKIFKSNLSPKDMEYFSKWGLSAEDIPTIQKALKENAEITASGVVKKIGLEDMPQDIVDKISVAVSRGIKSGVIQGDTIHLPHWMQIPGPIKNMMTQFLRFPIAANEILLRKGFSEDVAGLTATLLGAQMLAMTMYKLREDAEIELGLRSAADADYSFDSPDGFYNLSMKGLTYNAAFGALTVASDYGLILSGNPQVGKDYVPKDLSGVMGPSYSKLLSAQKVFKAVTNGEFDSEDLSMGAKQLLLPVGNFPIVGKAIDEYIKENTRRY